MLILVVMEWSNQDLATTTRNLKLFSDHVVHTKTAKNTRLCSQLTHVFFFWVEFYKLHTVLLPKMWTGLEHYSQAKNSCLF